MAGSARPSIKVMKSIPWRGSTRVYSNRYHFNGGTPADAAHWTTFSDAVVAAEKAIHGTDVTIVGTIGYAAGSDVPVFTKTYAVAGTRSISLDTAQAGEVAALVRYATTAKTTKNHPVYLMNYYHRVSSAGSGANEDLLLVTQKTLMNTYGNAWIAGFSDGTNTLVRSGPNGATATGVFVEPNLTHRDFPR